MISRSRNFPKILQFLTRFHIPNTMMYSEDRFLIFNSMQFVHVIRVKRMRNEKSDPVGP
jgi:hypothetical protein